MKQSKEDEEEAAEKALTKAAAVAGNIPMPQRSQRPGMVVLPCHVMFVSQRSEKTGEPGEKKTSG